MWQKFTERARRIIFYAQNEAERLGEQYVSTEHILLALTRDSDTVAARLLHLCGVSLEQVRSETEQQCGRGEARSGQDMQLTPRAKRAIDLTWDEARQLDNSYIGTEHLLLGLLREGDGLAGQILGKLGISLEQVRGQVRRMQKQPVPDTGPEQSPRPATPPTAWRPRRLRSSSVPHAVDAISTYAFGMDTGNFGLAVSKFADTAEVDYSAVGGPRQIITRADLEAFLQTLLDKPNLRVHTSLGQLLINPDNEAEFIAYYSARHFRGPLGHADGFAVFGRYHFEMHYDLITSLTVQVTATEGDPSVLTES